MDSTHAVLPKEKVDTMLAATQEKTSRVWRSATFLWVAAFLLKPGGTLVYSTCTINPKENEQMVHHALENYPLKLVSQGKAHLGDRGLPGQGLNEHEASLVQRFDPSNIELDTMGFFCAKFLKTGPIRQE
ncbi:unnamed protein product [Peronospora farinosa]|uniref:SAM-dependent MTase RsmB/NOP-type domain-containing protein n=1 Tax=Peronospora farinosa TaxID=134698 RepID=A0AAV0TEL3_9STRA|nr:unnamed protein product [Peronospora farinosa]